MSIESEVRRLSAWQRAVLDSADYCIISTDTRGVIATFNRRAERMLGYTAEEMIGRRTPELIHHPPEVEEYAEVLGQEMGCAIQPGFEVFVAKARQGIIDEREWHYVHKDGSLVPVYLSVTALRSEDGEIIGFLGICSDLTERKAMQATLRETETRYANLFNSSGDAICLIDREGHFRDCNPSALRLFGCEREQIIGSSVLSFSPPLQADGEPSGNLVADRMGAAFEKGYQFFEWRHSKFDGAPFDAEISLSAVRIGEEPCLQGIIRDITDRKRLEEQLAYQARHDSLTGLLNRLSLHETFPEHVRAAELVGGYVVMVLLDLDRFKEVNDTLGHHLGDRVLEQVGPRLKAGCVDPAATIVRLGGDEFAILKATRAPIEKVREAAEGLIAALREPFEVEGFQVSLGASIGITRHPEHGEDSHQLLRAADVAMYEAKRHGIGVQVYESRIDDYSTQRLRFGNELKQAISNDQLVLHYQPKIDIASGRISGFEALVRWDHPEHGLLYPDSFIDLVEVSEVIHPFTRAVIELATSDKKLLHDLGIREPVAINLSARNLIDDACLKSLEAALAGRNLSTTEIELELTESAVMQDPAGAVALLDKFKSIGVRVAIDDFGTGYSSLSYLRQLPVNALKIDRSFVLHMRSNTQESSIVRSTIALAHALDMKVVAEGVEDQETLALLRTMECDQAQGYGICRPQPLEKLIAWIESPGTGKR